MRAFCLLVVSAGALQADGGMLQWKSRAGPFEVLVFTAPVPLRAGPADISVLVERAIDNSVVLDAEVVLRLPSRQVTLNATHAIATNKIMYAANLDLSTPGNWDLELSIRSPIGSGSTHGHIQVSPSEPPLRHEWPYFAVVPACILLFVLNRFLKARARRV